MSKHTHENGITIQICIVSITHGKRNHGLTRNQNKAEYTKGECESVTSASLLIKKHYVPFCFGLYNDTY